MIASIVGKVISGVVTTVLEWLGLIHVGEEKQKAKDQAASLEDAKEANAERQKVNQESTSELDRDLGQFMRRPDAKP